MAVVASLALGWAYRLGPQSWSRAGVDLELGTAGVDLEPGGHTVASLTLGHTRSFGPESARDHRVQWPAWTLSVQGLAWVVISPR